MTHAIVFSKNRAAQLDLLLRSISERAPTLFNRIDVLYRTTNTDYLRGYKQCVENHPNVGFTYEHSFQSQTGALLHDSDQPYVAFLCDDDLVTRQHKDKPEPWQLLDEAPDMLCFSLRLGLNTNYCYPLRRDQQEPVIHERYRDTIIWSWPNSEGDWGYPGSLDGHVFRREQVIELLTGRDYTNPNRLEDTFTNRCFGREDTHPMMGSYKQSLITGIPANRVNDDYPNRSGETHPVEPVVLNTEYLDGKRLRYPISSGINAAHVELPLVFQ